MRIAVIGATGMVGSQITAEAAARGHQVQGHTRTAHDTGSVTTEALRFTDTEAVARVIDANDATVISVPGRDDYEAVIAAHRALIAAKPTGRLLVVGGAGALRVGDGLLLDSPEFPAEYLPEAKAFAQVHDDYAASAGLNWTMIAPSPRSLRACAPGSTSTAETAPPAASSPRKTLRSRPSMRSRARLTRAGASASPPQTRPPRAAEVTHRLTYVFDSYCGWCYGFGPAIRGLAADADIADTVRHGALFGGGRAAPSAPSATSRRRTRGSRP